MLKRFMEQMLIFYHLKCGLNSFSFMNLVVLLLTYGTWAHMVKIKTIFSKMWRLLTQTHDQASMDGYETQKTPKIDCFE